VGRPMGDHIDLSGPILKLQVTGQKIFGLHALGVTHSQGCVSDRSSDRTPEINLHNAMLEALLGLLGAQQIPDALWP
jgi:hypothetical protein